MSCTCNNCNCNDNTTGDSVNCPCDRFEHPVPYEIGAGLKDLPRQIAGFPEFRRAMIRAIREKSPLDDWKARQPSDLGLMLLEMWAYLCDSLSFYDKVISQEEYIRTALRRPSLRRLVALLGYLPRPAVGSTVWLTALADGREKIHLPAGTSFRSGAFNGNPPQVFELDHDSWIHPQANQWGIKPPHPGLTQTVGQSSFLIQPPQGNLAGKTALLYNAINPAASEGCWISEATAYSSWDQQRYTKIQLSAATKLPVNSPLAYLQFQIPAHTAGVRETGLSKTRNLDRGTHKILVKATNYILLDTVQSAIRKDQFLLIGNGTEIRAFRITATDTVFITQGGAQTVTLNSQTFTLPGIQQPVTKIWLNRPLDPPGATSPWADGDLSSLVVYFDLQPTGSISDEASRVLSPGDPLDLTEAAEKPFGGFTPSEFALVDKNNQAAWVSGAIDLDLSRLTPDQAQTWSPPLTNPVNLFGNFLQASRGETVSAEILGSGDASQINQSFTLKKSPLTYFAVASADNDQGVQNTLRVYVDNILWQEVPNFYRRGPGEEIYIVRQNDAADSIVTFGDGVWGKRIPSGTDNVTAYYRYGAGAAEPSAGIVNQLGSPVDGLRSINNPKAAFGGDDAASPEKIRTLAPRSVLTLGRAVSIPDMEAITADVPGVRVVQGLWHWQGQRQAPVVLIWYVGDPGLETRIVQRLHEVTDPDTPVEAEPATPVPIVVNLDLELDPRYIANPVLLAVKARLAAPGEGLLVPEQLGIGKPVFRSQIFETVLSVEGVLSVRNILWNGDSFSDYVVPGVPGTYFEPGDAGVFVNGIN